MKKSGLTIMIASHIVDDMYQGAIPALIPFFVAERHYTYAAVSGLTLAATLLSSVVQPVFGVLTDKRRMLWIIALGLTIAGIGVGLSGLSNLYILTWLAIALSGLGVAAYHPEATRVARLVTDGSQTGMSWFSIGGNIGFALGPIVVAPVLLIFGVGGTIILAIPALLMGTLLLVLQPKLVSLAAAGAERRSKSLRSMRDDWRSFLKLTGLVMSRSILFFGLSSFLALYVTQKLGGSKELGEVALTVFLVSGAVGTLTGGWLADRFGRITAERIGYGAAVPALIGLISVGQPWLFLFIVLTAVSVYIPFSVQVTLGQDYLPSRIGTASGVTLGLAVSVGGLFSPLLGFLADATSLRLILGLLIVLPLIALTIAFRLSDPIVKPARPHQEYQEAHQTEILNETSQLFK